MSAGETTTQTGGEKRKEKKSGQAKADRGKTSREGTKAQMRWQGGGGTASGRETEGSNGEQMALEQRRWRGWAQEGGAGKGGQGQRGQRKAEERLVDGERHTYGEQAKEGQTMQPDSDGGSEGRTRLMLPELVQYVGEMRRESSASGSR